MEKFSMTCCGNNNVAVITTLILQNKNKNLLKTIHAIALTVKQTHDNSYSYE